MWPYNFSPLEYQPICSNEDSEPCHEPGNNALDHRAQTHHSGQDEPLKVLFVRAHSQTLRLLLEIFQKSAEEFLLGAATEYRHIEQHGSVS